MNIWKNLESYEEKIEGETAEQNNDEVALLIKAFSHFGFGFTLLPPLDGTDLTIVRIGLLADNLDNLRVSIIAALKGYHRQAINLIRMVYENWLAFWYLIQFQEDAKYWLDPSWDKRPPKAETMRKRMEHPSQESSEKAKELVIELHRFAHTDPVAVLTHIGEDGLRIGTTYDSGDFEASVNAIVLWIGMNLDAIESYISDEKWENTHNEIKDEIQVYMDKYNEQFFENIWQKIQTRLKPGMSIANWTVLKGYFGKDISVEKCTTENIHFRSPTAKTIQIVPKEDFEVVWEVWSDYKLEKVERQQIRNKTRYSRYIIDVFRWLEETQ